MPPGESSCPGGLEDVWQRGVEGTSGRLTLTGSRSLLYFPKKREAYLSHCKKVYLPQFRKLSLTNFQNCGRYTFLLRLIILLTDRILSHSPNFGQPTRVQKLLKRFLNLFLECWVRKDFLGVCQGCQRFLTISYPRWDQPISDIFI